MAQPPVVCLAPSGITFAAEVAITVLPHPRPVPLLWVFRHLGARAVRALQQRAATDDLTDHQVLCQVLVGWGQDPHAVPEGDDAPPPPWRGPVDAAGAPAPFSADALAELLDNHPAAGPELWNGYLRELRRSRLGN